MSDTPYYRDHYYQSLLKAVRANPADDLPRLVMADWLDENKQPERAAWVRHHVRGDALPPWFLDGSPSLEWLPAIDGYVRAELPAAIEYRPIGRADRPVRVAFARGFVDRVSGPLITLVGGECERCGPPQALPPYRWVCPDCHGTGRITGVLRDLLRREPVREVVAADCVLFDNAGAYSGVSHPLKLWWLPQRGVERLPWELPGEVYERLANDTCTSEADAHAAMSAAILDLCSTPEEVSR